MANYVEKNLRANEQLRAKAEISWVAIVPSAVWAGLVFLGSLFGGLPSALIGFLTAAIIMGIAALSIYGTELGVTDKKIIGKVGVLRVNSLDSYLEKIDNFAISESLIGRLLGYATIQISTTSMRMRFHYVKNAMQFKNVVLDAIEAREIEKIAMQADLNAQAVIPMPQQPIPPQPIAGQNLANIIRGY